MHDQIYLVQPIFCPNDKGFELQYNSIKSLFEFLEVSNIPFIKGVWGGWCKEEWMWEKLLDDFDINAIDYKRNYGKAYVVNDLVKRFVTNEKYILTYDSDIKFDVGELHLFDRLIAVADQIENFGLLSLNQKEHNCQLFNHYNKMLCINEEIMRWCDGGGGIAGGCLFISTAAWNKIGGYRVMGVYDSDDGFMMVDMHDRKFFAATIETISVIHPWDEIKEGYSKWKSDILHNRRLGKDAGYNEKLKDAEDFWK